uniref:Homeobox protein Meis1 (Trinotate prediction) n=1 Tax=Myxobolus squamalis TaxID=59785 RepID=A0A6B2G0A1_MYXSQ
MSFDKENYYNSPHLRPMNPANNSGFYRNSCEFPANHYYGNFPYSNYQSSPYERNFFDEVRNMENANTYIMPGRRAVVNTNILRDWYFQNLAYPYPSREEKLQLARLSCMSVLQVNNWFANFRRKMKKVNQETPSPNSSETAFKVSSSESQLGSNETSRSLPPHHESMARNLGILADVASL